MTDFTDLQDRYDASTAGELAAFIRNHIDGLVAEALRRYQDEYSFSVRGGVDDEGAFRWATNEYVALADQLESGAIDPHEYQGTGGDIVIQREPQLYPIDAFLETCLYHARVIAQLIWETHLGDTRTMNALLATLETHTQMRMQTNVAAFMHEICRPRALARTWRLGVSPAGSPDSRLSKTSLPQKGQSLDPTHGLIATLTPREAQMAQLIGAGRSNAEIATELGLRISTVKNTLSKIYAKLGISSRVELALKMRSRMPDDGY